MMSLSAGRPARGARVTPPARLLKFHGNDLVNLLIVGGTAGQRLSVARTFHDRSRTRIGPLVKVDAALEENRVRAGLEAWISGHGPESWGDPLRFAERGTLFVDSIAALSIETQRMLLAFTRRRADQDFDHRESAWMGRLAVGNEEHLAASVAQGRFSSTLYDTLDKVLIELPAMIDPDRRAARSCAWRGARRGSLAPPAPRIAWAP
jgi:DNA-binding NtrC family response regulator